jgi:hypothetical protein
MTGFLLDTNVLSEFSRAAPETLKARLRVDPFPRCPTFESIADLTGDP